MNLKTPFLLDDLDNYHRKCSLLEKRFLGQMTYDSKDINDDLMYYTEAFSYTLRSRSSTCALITTLREKENDPRDNYQYFNNIDIEDDFDWFMLSYFYRCCGSGRNLTPKAPEHFVDGIPRYDGYGDFWLLKSLVEGKNNYQLWLEDLKKHEGIFTNNTGYILPLIKGGLKKYLNEFSFFLMDKIYRFCQHKQQKNRDLVDYGNQILLQHGYNQQTFVLTLVGLDISRYRPDLICSKSKIYPGTSARQMLRLIFDKDRKQEPFEFHNDCLSFLSNRYSMDIESIEELRLCDYYRYLNETQSSYIIQKYKGRKLKNNSLVKEYLGQQRYDQYIRDVVIKK